MPGRRPHRPPAPAAPTAALARRPGWPGIRGRIRDRIPGRLRGFGRDAGGATAIEFGILALPFLALLCVLAEAGVAALSQQTLDFAVDRAARVLRTGEFQERADGSDPGERLRRTMCAGAVLFPCRELRLDVTRAGSFAGSQSAEPYDPTKKAWTAGFGSRFDCPTGDDVVSVRAAVPVMRLFGFVDPAARRMSDQTHLLISTAVFRAEAYDGKPCS